MILSDLRKMVDLIVCAIRLAMKHLGKVKPIDLNLTMLSSPELRELLSTWREAMNSGTPMGQALGFYKIIERVHKYRVDREARTRGTSDTHTGGLAMSQHKPPH